MRLIVAVCHNGCPCELLHSQRNQFSHRTISRPFVLYSKVFFFCEIHVKFSESCGGKKSLQSHVTHIILSIQKFVDSTSTSVYFGRGYLFTFRIWKLLLPCPSSTSVIYANQLIDDTYRYAGTRTRALFDLLVICENMSKCSATETARKAIHASYEFNGMAGLN